MLTTTHAATYLLVIFSAHQSYSSFYTIRYALTGNLLSMFDYKVGSKPGIWSRSLCLSHGLKAGSMLDGIRHALTCGYAVCVLNPNTNSVAIPGSATRIPIANSFSPEVNPTYKHIDKHLLSIESRSTCLGYHHRSSKKQCTCS